MFSLICLFVPPVIMTWIICRVMCDMQNEGIGNDKVTGQSWPRTIGIYALSVIGLNCITLLILSVIFHNNEYILEQMNTISMFAVKYMLMASAIGILLPVIVKYVMTHIKITVQWGKFGTMNWGYILCCIYALVLFAIHFFRIFDNNFNGDETFGIELVRGSCNDVIAGTAADVHPPLYYLFLKLICTIFGHNGVSYHFASIIPCAVVLVFALTTVWKQFGGIVSAILISFASLVWSAVTYHTEVRMYSMGGMFVLLSFYFMHNILQNNRKRDYVFFVLMSLGAAYTHYYCLVNVAFFYVVLLIYSLVHKREYLKRMLISCVVTVIAYIPWLMVLLETFARTKSDFWIISAPGYWETVKYLFASDFQNIFPVFFMLGILSFVLYETGIFSIKEIEKGKRNIIIQLAKFNCSKNLIWIFAGVLCIFGTIGFGLLISRLYRPMFNLYYALPMSYVAWLILGICVSRCWGKKVYAFILVAMIIYCGIPDLIAVCKYENNIDNRLKATLEATSEIDDDDVLLMTYSDVVLYSGEYYYPGTKRIDINAEGLPVFDRNISYWLFIENPLEEELTEELAKQGYTAENVIEYGNLSTHQIFVYKLVRRMNHE